MTLTFHLLVRKLDLYLCEQRSPPHSLITTFGIIVLDHVSFAHDCFGKGIFYLETIIMIGQYGPVQLIKHGCFEPLRHTLIFALDRDFRPARHFGPGYFRNGGVELYVTENSEDVSCLIIHYLTIGDIMSDI